MKKKILSHILVIFLFLLILTGIFDYVKNKDNINIPILIILVVLFSILCKHIFFDYRSTEKNIHSNSNRIPESESESESIISYSELNVSRENEVNIEKIKMDLKRAALLYETVQTTEDKKLFFLSLNEICQILYSLIAYEDCVNFSTPPSEQLKTLNLKRNDLINALEERIRLSPLNLDEYAKKCNKYITLEDKSDFDTMDGHDFEYFCADLLKNNGFQNVEVTQGSGDHGIDILAEKDDITYAIQCKCYSKDISNSAVQQAHTGKSIYKKDIAVVMTNRNFTLQAKEEAEALGVKLWNREKLLSFINNSKK